MKKTIMVVATVVAVSLGSTSFVNTVHANPTNDIESQQSSIKSQRAEIKKNLSKADAEIADVLIDLKEINAEIVKVENALKANEKVMKETEEQISNSEEEITVLEEDIVKLEDAIAERNEILKRRITALQKSGGSIGFLEVIFGSKDFNEFISRTTAVTKITDSDANLIREQEEDKIEVEVQQNNLEAKLAEQLENQTELKGIKELILVQKEENEASKKQLKNKETEIKALKAELTNKDSNLASVEAKIRRDIAAAREAESRAIAAQNVQNDAANLVTLSNKTTNEQNTTASNNNSTSTETVTTASSNNATNSEKATTTATTTQKQPASKPVSGNSGNLSAVINAGYGHLGTPYVWAGKGPGGFDCSGFVSWAFKQGGISVPSSTAGLQSTGQKVSYSNIQPGDIVYFNTYKVNGHVGIYVGNGQFIGAQNSTGLAVASMSSGYWKDHFAGHVRRVK